MDIGSNFVLEEDGSIFIDSSKLSNLVAEYALVKTMRASILTLGPMLTKYKEAKISLPGGCAIGTRPVNLHLDALEKMGATIEVKNGYIYAKAKELVGAQINFDLISVTATENIIMAATLAKGITTINNAAQEPEVTDLIRCLKKMGAKINVFENKATVVGSDKLFPATMKATDLRASMSLIIASLASEGRSEVLEIEHLKRGYENIENKLSNLGADIKLSLIHI